MILKSETYHFHRLDLTRQAGFIVTIYDEDGLRLAAMPPAQAFAEARKIVEQVLNSIRSLVTQSIAVTMICFNAQRHDGLVGARSRKCKR
jgi:hypothetical protein